MGIFGPKLCHLRAVQVLLHFHRTQSATFRAHAQYMCTILRPGAIGRPSPPTILSINQAVQY